MNIGDLILTLLADGSKLEGDISKQANAAAEKGGQKAGTTLGNRMSTAAKAGLTALGAAGGAVFAGAIEAGANFEDQLRTINTVAGLTDDELAQVGDNIQALSRETGKTTDDLTSGFYDLVSAGVPAGEAINVLRDSAKFATGALGTTGEAVDLVTSAMNAYGLAAKDSGRITDIFAKAVADGKVTAAELGASIANIAPIAASAGISLEEVSAGYALLTAKGVPAAQAATQMRAAISALIAPNEKLNEIQKRTGINFAELAKTKGLAVALEELRKATGGNADAFVKALGPVEAYQFALAVTGDNAEAMAEQIVETGDASGLAAAQYDEASKSSKKMGDRFAAVINTFIQDVGGAGAVFAPFLMTLNALAPALRGLISPAKLAGAAIGGLVTNLVPKIPIPKAFGDRILRLFGKSVVSSTATEAVSTSIGGKISGLISRAWGKVAGSAAVKAAIGAAGAASGAIYAAASAAVETLAGPMSRAWSALPGSSAFSSAVKAAGVTSAGLFTAASTAAFIAAPIVVAWAFSTIPADKRTRPGANTLDFGAMAFARPKVDPKAFEGVFDKVDWAGLKAELEHRGGDMSAGLAMGITEGVETEVKPSLRAMGQSVKDSVVQIGPLAKALGREIPESVAGGVLAKQNVVTDALATFRDLVKNALSPGKQIARDIGILTSKELAEGLKDKRPAVRAEARRVQAVAEQDLAELILNGGKVGKKAAEELAKKLKSKNATVRKSAERVRDIVNGKIDDIPTAAGKAGTQAGSNLMANFKRAVNANGTVTIQVRTSDNTKGGRALGGPVKAGEPWWVGERGPEIFVPDVNGRVLSHADSVKGMASGHPLGGGGGDTINVNMPVTGVLRVETPADLARPLRQLAETGVISNPRRRRRIEVPTRAGA